MTEITQEDGKLIRRHEGEILQVDPWGANAVRVRCRPEGEILDLEGALLRAPESENPKIEISDNGATMAHGDLLVSLHEDGHLSFHRKGEENPVLEECWIHRRIPDRYRVPRRFLGPVKDDYYEMELQLKASQDEIILGMGQGQEGLWNLKHSVQELHHHNTTYSIPFYTTNKGYGLLWNHPGRGRAIFATNITRFEARTGRQIDYWFCLEDNPATLIDRYTEITGRPQPLPEEVLGFWQCKNRYKNQDEILEVAREFKKRDLPLDVMVVDYYHWTHMGEWEFNKQSWPDPAAMVKELNELGVRTMASVWPTVTEESRHFDELQVMNGLIKHDGHDDKFGWAYDNDTSKDPVQTYYLDASNPEATAFQWDKIKKNYLDIGIKMFWLDENEPSLGIDDYRNVQYQAGWGQDISNLYPNWYYEAFDTNLRREGIDLPVLLGRAGWAGAQKYGSILWSGDVESTWDALQKQITCGLQVAMSGITWWNTDIGGHLMKNCEGENFEELLIRWFQYGCFTPIMRIHGKRDLNEIWAFGEDNYQIMRYYLMLRYRLKPYIAEQMKLACKTGLPIMRPMLLDFPQDQNCWTSSDQFLFGPDILVAPIAEEKKRNRKVYLPTGERWHCTLSGQVYQGGEMITVDSPLSRIPVFIRNDASVKDCFDSLN
jgi:alpha-D-xyloside xylohydrolase